MNKIISFLRKHFDCNITYQYAGDIHRLRIESRPKQWIYIPREHLEDAGEDRILEIIRAHVLNMLEDNTQKWIAVESAGIRLVDEYYGKQQP